MSDFKTKLSWEDGVDTIFEAVAPAAGVDNIYLVPATTCIFVRSVNITFIASGAAGNRQICLAFLYGGLFYQRITTAAVIIANVTAEILWGYGLTNRIDLRTNTTVNCHLPFPFLLRPGDTLRTDTEGLDAADQFGAMGILCRTIPVMA